MKGAFTGARGERKGLFRKADGGVLFLDEVGELKHRTQAILLRAIGEGEVAPLGSNDTVRVDVRLVAATNQPLKQQVEEGTFREDLYYRLCNLRVTLPPVRQREEDWSQLLDFFMRRMCERHGTVKTISDAAMTLLRDYTWPGNVREIQNVVATGFCLSSGSSIEVDHVINILDPDALGSEKAPLCVSTSSRRTVAQQRFNAMRNGEATFWEAVREPFMNRDIGRPVAQRIIQLGLDACSGSTYKDALDVFRVDTSDYDKFMDFLRHHNLKPPE